MARCDNNTVLRRMGHSPIYSLKESAVTHDSQFSLLKNSISDSESTFEVSNRLLEATIDGPQKRGLLSTVYSLGPKEVDGNNENTPGWSQSMHTTKSTKSMTQMVSNKDAL